VSKRSRALTGVVLLYGAFALPAHGQERGYALSVEGGYEFVAASRNSDLEGGLATDLYFGRFWSRGFELGFRTSLKFYREGLLCAGFCDPGLRGPIAVEFLGFAAEGRYWFRHPAAGHTIQPFVAGRAGYAMYIGTLSADGLRLGVGAGVQVRISRLVGLVTTLSVDRILFGDLGFETSDLSVASTRVGVRGGVRFQLP